MFERCPMWVLNLFHFQYEVFGSMLYSIIPTSVHIHPRENENVTRNVSRRNSSSNTWTTTNENQPFLKLVQVTPNPFFCEMK